MNRSSRLKPRTQREATSRRPCASFGAIAFLAWTFLCLPPLSAQPTMQTILTNGVVSNRVNIVVFSEGYTSDQLTRFLVDATNSVNGLLAHQPYFEYRPYF